MYSSDISLRRSIIVHSESVPNSLAPISRTCTVLLSTTQCCGRSTSHGVALHDVPRTTLGVLVTCGRVLLQ